MLTVVLAIYSTQELKDPLLYTNGYTPHSNYTWIIDLPAGADPAGFLRFQAINSFHPKI